MAAGKKVYIDAAPGDNYTVNFETNPADISNVTATVTLEIGKPEDNPNYDWTVTAPGGGTADSGSGTETAIDITSFDITGIDLSGTEGIYTITLTITDEANNTGPEASDTLDSTGIGGNSVSSYLPFNQRQNQGGGIFWNSTPRRVTGLTGESPTSRGTTGRDSLTQRRQARSAGSSAAAVGQVRAVEPGSSTMVSGAIETQAVAGHTSRRAQSGESANPVQRFLETRPEPMVAEPEMDDGRLGEEDAGNGGAQGEEGAVDVSVPAGAGGEAKATEAGKGSEEPAVLLSRDLRTLLALLIVSGLALAVMGVVRFFRRNGRG